MRSAIEFRVTAQSRVSRARAGVVRTPHGAFETPAFMPVGTRATVKGLLPAQVAATGAQIVLNNTYHLLLRPGPGVVRRLGGVHAFMRWDGPILTDSGGYQAYSLADTSEPDDEGVTFRSIVDGSLVRLTPERAVEVQNTLGADIIMPLDDCPPATPWIHADEGEGVPGPRAGGDRRLERAARRDARLTPGDHASRVARANERSVRWLARCAAAHQRPLDQALFGIVQGGTDPGAREWCARRVTEMDLPGYAIGGVAVGELPDAIAEVVRRTAPLLPEDRPRYLMGVGYERDLLSAVLSGVDMFDCVLPTRNGRNANAFTSRGQVRLRNARFAEDPGVIEADCDCAACAGGFSRGYLRHLFMAGEMLGPILVSVHNLRHFQRFMADIRRTIGTDGWAALADRWPIAAAGLPRELCPGSGGGGKCEQPGGVPG